MAKLSEEAIGLVALYFQALSDPTRLKVLNELRAGERNVGELARTCGCTLANVSKHLSLLTKQGMVDKHNVGTSVYYHIADKAIYELCDLVCGTIVVRLEKQAEVAERMRSDTQGEIAADIPP
jgi:DNA-binding transcriptional ArsR family regulator